MQKKGRDGGEGEGEKIQLYFWRSFILIYSSFFVQFIIIIIIIFMIIIITLLSLLSSERGKLLKGLSFHVTNSWIWWVAIECGLNLISW